MVRIRLRRVGRKKQASYRIVAADARSPRDGRFIEILGHYNPRTNPPTVIMKSDRVKAWLGNGAEPTEAVRGLLVSNGLWKEFYGTDYVYPAPKKAAEKAEEKAPAAEEA
ncbi:MAG: 30S ribosomal protein S16 [bacterium]|nr:30S ribosomal protein S16 [bacterium]